MQTMTFSLLEVIHSILTKLLACVRIASFVKNNEAFLLFRRSTTFCTNFSPFVQKLTTWFSQTYLWIHIYVDLNKFIFDKVVLRSNLGHKHSINENISFHYRQCFQWVHVIASSLMTMTSQYSKWKNSKPTWYKVST